MAVYKESRYEECPYTGILGKDGKVRNFLHPRVPLDLDNMGDEFFLRTIKAGEVIDEYSWDVAEKARLWWVTADVNDIMFPLDLTPGTDVVVPFGFLGKKPEF